MSNHQGQNRSHHHENDHKSEAKKVSTNSINETLKMLDEAAGASSQEIKKMGQESIAYLSDAKDKVIKTTKDAALKVDKTAHESPWYFVGATAAVVGLAGFFLGRKSKSIA